MYIRETHPTRVFSPLGLYTAAEAQNSTGVSYYSEVYSSSCLTIQKLSIALFSIYHHSIIVVGVRVCDIDNQYKRAMLCAGNAK